MKNMLVIILAFIPLLIGWVGVLLLQDFGSWSWQWLICLLLAQVLIYPALNFWIAFFERGLAPNYRMKLHSDTTAFPNRWVLQKRELFSSKWQALDSYDGEGRQNPEGSAKIFFICKHGINLK